MQGFPPSLPGSMVILSAVSGIDDDLILVCNKALLPYIYVLHFIDYNGMLPCFLRGMVSVLFASMRKARITLARVSRGSITSSM